VLYSNKSAEISKPLKKMMKKDFIIINIKKKEKNIKEL
jgi:hypothetical protein